jgi:uncharacterized protein (TIGR03437 family)
MSRPNRVSRLPAICVLALGCAAIWLPSAGAQGAQGNGGFQYYGITHVNWSYNEYTFATATASRNDLAATNFNWAGVLVTWYQPTITSNAMVRYGWTPSDAAVTQAIQEFHDKHIKVMLKPHVDVSDAAGSWRGNINPTDPDTWFANYTQFIVQYAQMAESLGVEMLCIGTELKTVTGSANQARWYSVIDAIRNVYHGALTYAANATSAGDEFTSVSFWDRLDLIGLDGYFALTNKNDPTLAELVAAWRQNANRLNLVATITNFYNAHQKPIIFTEIGYKSSAGANTEPWNFSHAGVYDPTEQRNCIDAAFTVWSQWSSWMKGFFWWAWPVPAPQPFDTDYNPRGKPAADLLRAWQSPPDPQNAVTNAASYSAQAVAPGAIVSLFGASLSAATSQSSAAPLPTVLGDTTVTFNGIPAPLYFASTKQVNAQVPFEVAPGSAIAEVISNSGIALTQLPVGEAGPGIFTLDRSGTGDGALSDAVTGALVTSGQPIAAGGYLAIYCTGLGAVTPAPTTGDVPATLTKTTVDPSVLIDGQPASLSWAGLAPGFVGLYQVNAQVPATLTAGSHRLQLVVNGAASNTVTFAVR